MCGIARNVVIHKSISQLFLSFDICEHFKSDRGENQLLFDQIIMIFCLVLDQQVDLDFYSARYVDPFRSLL